MTTPSAMARQLSNSDTPAAFRPLPAPRSLTHALVERLTSDITSGKFAPGSRLPTEQEFAERFGVSHNQVKYALQQVRKRWERLLRQEICDQVGADVDVEEEMRKLV